MVRKLKWQTAELVLLDYVLKQVAQVKFLKSSLDSSIQTDADKYASLVGQLPRARGLGVYDVALTWQRSRVRFSPSPLVKSKYCASEM